MNNWKSSVLRCYAEPDHCLICKFIDGDRSEEAMMAVIRRLDTDLDREEQECRKMTDALVAAVTRNNSDTPKKLPRPNRPPATTPVGKR